ncbi:hypothetical protein ASZ90_009327 [hydrocarbon metagenome]|uniref:Uncharacterized protein n=1 Tax=hydrocarbon metagenome TaxID=938273 RepID=A0A0W8FJ37_9ZZZZ
MGQQQGSWTGCRYHGSVPAGHGKFRDTKVDVYAADELILKPPMKPPEGAAGATDGNFYEENRQKAPHFSGGMNAVHR